MRRLLAILLIAALLGAVGIRQADAAGSIRYVPPVVTIVTDKPSYAPGAVLSWRYTLYNGNDQPLSLTFTSAQVYDLILRSEGKVVARWSKGMQFADVMSTRTIAIGETMELTGTWRLPGNLAAGSYELEFVLTSTSTEPTGTKTTFMVGDAVMPGLGVIFTTDKLIYRVGTKLTVRYTITNLTSGPIVLDFPTGQQYNWTITDIAGKVIYDWQADRAFTQAATSLTIPAGHSDAFESSWDIPADLKPSGFYIHFTVLDDSLGALKTQRAAVLMGSTPPTR